MRKDIIICRVVKSFAKKFILSADPLLYKGSNLGHVTLQASNRSLHFFLRMAHKKRFCTLGVILLVCSTFCLGQSGNVLQLPAKLTRSTRAKQCY